MIAEAASPNEELDDVAGTWVHMPAAPKRAGEARMALCECVIDLVAAYFDVCGKELRGAGRSSAPIARVRQIGMYIAHVVLQIPMKEVGRGFARDRTTVAHACHVIEDLRDDAEFDGIVSRLERLVLAFFPSGGPR